MQLSEFIQLFKRKWPILATFVLVFATLAFIFSIVQPQRYRADQKVLIVPNFSEEIDPYTASRSTEYLSNLLTEVMYSQSFYQKVVTSGYGVTSELFPSDAVKQRKAWSKTLGTRVLGDTGIIEIAVFHTDRYTAEQLALAVTHVLTTEHGQYHSRGNAVTIQTIDEAVVSNRPVQPSIPLNTSAGAVLGLLAGLAFIYLFPNKEFNFSFEEHKLVEVKDHDWSHPKAIPLQTDMSGNGHTL